MVTRKNLRLYFHTVPDGYEGYLKGLLDIIEDRDKSSTDLVPGPLQSTDGRRIESSNERSHGREII
jgi:hypothetical protein